MNITDTIADMLTIIRNANDQRHESVDVPASKLKKSIAEILLEEGYIKGFEEIEDNCLKGHTSNYIEVKVPLKRESKNNEELINKIKSVRIVNNDNKTIELILGTDEETGLRGLAYYQTKYDIYFNEVYMSPSHYLFMRNYYKVVQALDFCESELNNWYDLVKDNKSIRVSVVHNNLKLDHYIKSDKDYLISWDNYILDTPILDIVNLYKNEYKYYNFEAVLKRYFNNYPLLDYEQKLLFILLVLPPIIKEEGNEFKNSEIMQENFEYIFKTEELIRPYYANNEEKEQE